jgi:hypothetical protein
MEILILMAVVITFFIVVNKSGLSHDTELGSVDTSSSTATVRIAQAIAAAEGFYLPGSRPSRNHNPGDMTADLIGRAVGTDGSFVVYANDSDGWKNLYVQINAWFNGTSSYHNSNSTIADLAGLGHETGYTSTDQNSWAQQVANQLGVDINTPIGDVA